MTTKLRAIEEEVLLHVRGARPLPPTPKSVRESWARGIDSILDTLKRSPNKKSIEEVESFAKGLAELLAPENAFKAAEIARRTISALSVKQGGPDLDEVTSSRKRGPKRGSTVPSPLPERTQKIALALDSFLARVPNENVLYDADNLSDASTVVTLAHEFNQWFEANGGFRAERGDLVNLCIVALDAFTIRGTRRLPVATAMEFADHLAREVRPSVTSRVKRFFRGY